MELTRIMISETNEQQLIWLKEVEGERSFPIVIHIFEAMAIDRRVKDIQAQRPLTHDLLGSVIEHLGGTLESIAVTSLRDHTFYATLNVRQNGEIVEVDSRPSDAIALAVGVGAPIFVAEEVLDEVCQGE